MSQRGEGKENEFRCNERKSNGKEREKVYEKWK